MSWLSVPAGIRYINEKQIYKTYVHFRKQIFPIIAVFCADLISTQIAELTKINRSNTIDRI